MPAAIHKIPLQTIKTTNMAHAIQGFFLPEKSGADTFCKKAGSMLRVLVPVRTAEWLTD